MSFNQAVIIPANISSIDDQILGIRVKAGKDSDPKNLDIKKWTIESKIFLSDNHNLGFEKISFKIKLEFAIPLRISEYSNVSSNFQ